MPSPCSRHQPQKMKATGTCPLGSLEDRRVTAAIGVPVMAGQGRLVRAAKAAATDRLLPCCGVLESSPEAMGFVAVQARDPCRSGSCETWAARSLWLAQTRMTFYVAMVSRFLWSSRWRMAAHLLSAAIARLRTAHHSSSPAINNLGPRASATHLALQVGTKTGCLSTAAKSSQVYSYVERHGNQQPRGLCPTTSNCH
jgi:hypothetical protein